MKRYILSGIAAAVVVGVMSFSGCGSSGGGSKIDEISIPAGMKNYVNEKQSGSISNIVSDSNVDETINTNGKLGSTSITIKSIRDGNGDTNKCTQTDPCKIEIERKCHDGNSNDLNYNLVTARDKAFAAADAASGDIGTKDSHTGADVALRYSGFIDIKEANGKKIGCNLDFEIQIKCALDRDGTTYYLMDDDPQLNDYKVHDAAVVVESLGGDKTWYIGEVVYENGKRYLKNLKLASDPNQKGISIDKIPARVYVFIKQDKRQRSAVAVDGGTTGATGSTGSTGAGG
jgi:hypothetical protein